MPNNNPNGGAQWTEEHVAALHEYIAAGDSFARIAALINARFGTGYTRNSTIGKAARLGLKSLNSTGWSPKTPRKARDRSGEKKKYVRATHNSTRALRIVREVAIENLCSIELAPLNVSLADNVGCWYPTGGSAPNHLFCGHLKRDGSSYCLGHHFLCWVPPRALADAAPRREAA